MLKIKVVPVLSRMISKLDVQPIIDVLSTDIFNNTTNAKEALAELQGDKATELGGKIIAAILPQLGRIGDDVPEFVALYKGIPISEAEELDLAETINEIIYDDAIRHFFTTALRKKVEPTL